MDGGSTTRSLAEIRRAAEGGHAGRLWASILSHARADLDVPILLPDTPLPKRSHATVKAANLDFIICDAAGQRIKRHALANLLTGEAAFRDAAVEQLDAILDDARWPDWIDQAHVRFGHPAGLRTGMLAYDSGLAFDWLYGSLDEQTRDRLAHGINRRGIEPLRVSLTQDPWWMEDLNNWTTTIVGGVAVAAMALDGRIPDTDDIVRHAVETFDRYLEIYGRDGEFNESPAYANATERPVAFFKAFDDWSARSSARLAQYPFPDTCEWLRYMTLPQGYIAAFGDSHTDAVPWSRHIAAIAASSRNPVIQDYYLSHASEGDAVEFLWFDDALQPASATGILPLGAHFPEHGGCFSFRESWDNDVPQMVVYGRSAREENHEHHDAGQLCIDVGGERMIRDLGSPSGYPADFFEAERWNYYNASVRGHNVLQFEDREMRIPDWKRGDGRVQGIAEITGHMRSSEFVDGEGARLLMDLTAAYEDVSSLRRAVVVLQPGIVAVLDVAELPYAQRATLRWHTANRAEPDSLGRFVVRAGDQQLFCRAGGVTPDSGADVTREAHRYTAPFNKSRTGELLDDRRESFVAVREQATSVRWLSLFATPESTGARSEAVLPSWQFQDGAWTLSRGSDMVTVLADEQRLLVRADNGRELQVDLV